MCTLIAVSHSSSWISLMYIVTCHDHSSATISESRNAHSLGFYSLWPNSLVPTVFPHRSSSGNSSNSSGLFLVGSVLASTTSLSPVHLHEKQAHKVQHVLVEERRGCTVAFVFPRIYTHFFSLSCSDGHPKDLQKYFFEGVSAHFNKPLVVTSPNDNWCSHLRQ